MFNFDISSKGSFLYVFRIARTQSSFSFDVRNWVVIADINKVVPMQIFLADFRTDATIARLFLVDSLAKSD